MEIEGLLSSLSFDEDSGASGSSLDCLQMLSSPQESQLGYSTCLSQSSTSFSQTNEVPGLKKWSKVHHTHQQKSSQLFSKQQSNHYDNLLLQNLLNQQSQSSSAGTAVAAASSQLNVSLLPLSISASSSSSQWSDTRFIPSRKHSKYPVMLSSAHEVKTTKSTKGQYVQNENDYSVAQLYMKHVLMLPTDETGQASKKKLAFSEIQSKKSSAKQQQQQQGITNSNYLHSLQNNYQDYRSINSSSGDCMNGYYAGTTSTTGSTCLEDMLRNMRMESGLLQHEFELQQASGMYRGSGLYGSSASGVDGSGSQGVIPTPANLLSSKRKSKMYAYTQYKVLDAPGLIDDFYLNLLDWSSKNLMAVGLGSQVYVWNGFNNRVSKICEMQQNPLIDPQMQQQQQQPDSNKVQAIQWSQSGNLLGVGDSNGLLSIYDQNTSKLVSQMQLHSDRIGSLAWKDDFLVASGSRDKTILCTDIRVPTQNAYRTVQRYTGHKQEVCGLKWSFDSQMLASGGNDNKLFVWSLRTSNHINKFAEHKAGVKAIAWSPHQHGLLVSGGGTADRTIRFWNTSIGKQIESIEVNSQVCNLVFSKNENEFVSTHGFQDNDIIVWKYPTLEKIACLTGHTCRVLQLGLSPCSTKIVTGAGDETLRFWDVFKQNPNMPSKNSSSLLDSKFDLR